MEVASTSTNNSENDYTISELNYVRETIETMNKFNQIEVLRILNKKNSKLLNENKNGVLINLSELDKSTIEQLQIYINYVNTQETSLKKAENQKEHYKNAFFND